MMVVGSNEEYGMVRPEELPIQEPPSADQPLRCEQSCPGYVGLPVPRQLPVIRVRPFNHMGPARASASLHPTSLNRCRDRSRPRPPVIHVRNLEAERDFTDA